jgi:CubicO group peptidase (beta-lactamase class C family)
MQQVTRLLVVLVVASGCSNHDRNNGGGVTSADAPQGHAQSDGGQGDGSQGSDNPVLDAEIMADMNAAGVPGLATVVIRGDQIIYAHGYGLANIADARPVTTDTVFNVASISKTFVSVALMQQVEAGLIGLDDDVGNTLPFPVRNPSFPNTPITPRMLLSHTATGDDTAKEWNNYVIGMDATMTLRAWLESYIEPGGANYTVNSWLDYQPGTHYYYANMNTDIAGEVVETLAGANLQTYSQANIFGPLGMTESSWFLADLDQADIAMPYTYGAAGNYVAWGFECYPDYPNGQLRTSASQLARYLMMFAGGGQLGDQRLLSAASVTQMETVQPNSEEGLSWESWSYGGHTVLGHSGVDSGVSADMWFDPATGAGFVVLTNSDVYLTNWTAFEAGNNNVPALAAMNDLETALLKLAEP